MSAYRLLLVSHAVDIGGAERGILLELSNINRDIFVPSFACPFDGPLTNDLKKLGIDIYPGYPSRRLLGIRRRSLGRNRLAVLLYPVAFLESVVSLSRLIRREKFDLVLTESAKADIYGTLAGWLVRRPVVCHIHDIFEAPVFSDLNLWLIGTFLSHFSSRIISNSEASKKALVDLGVPEKKIKTVYFGIDSESARRTKKPKDVRMEFGIDPEAPVAGMVGRLVDWKGPDYFIKAAARVKEAVPEARFLVIGDAIHGEKSYVDTLKSLCKELGLEDRIVFTGFRDDVLDIMSAMDVMVHASVLPEPFGLVLIEAMAEECPVVATSGGGASEIVEDGVTGLLVPPGDVEAMAGAITTILSDRNRAREMGAAGLRRVSESFTVERMTRGMEREILEALENG